jgi:hypothetical protein
VFGEMDDQIVTTCLQGAEQGQFNPRLANDAQLLPLAVNSVHLADCRMQGQHLGRIGINQCINFGLGRMRLEH